MRRTDRGFALLLVVIVLALMAALVAAFAGLARTDLRATANAAELARARALAEAGYAMALNDLVNPIQGRATPTDGRSREVLFDGGKITIAVQDEAGKIDLNWAPVELIAGLLDELDVPGDVEARILDAVGERRGSAPLPQNAPGDLAAGGLLEGPTLEELAQRPFDSVGELQSLARIDATTYARLFPAFTVYSESRRINLYAAPRIVLMAIPGVTPEMADAIIAARVAADTTVSGQPAAAQLPYGSANYAGLGGLRAATITADAVTDIGARFGRRAVVSFTGLPRAPVRVLEWREALE
jgi:general secretion pathway protein K